MAQIVWTHGEKFNKTKKDNRPILNNKNEIVNNIPLRGETTRNRDKLQQDKLESFVQERPMLVQTYQNPFLTKVVGLRCNCRIDARVDAFERLPVVVCFYFLFHGHPTSEKFSVVA